MHIDYLFFKGCPSHERGFELLNEVLQEEGVTADIERIEVDSDQQAVDLKFLVSPTIRVNGVDIDPEAESTKHYALTCRVYKIEDGRGWPLPAKDLIRNAIRAGSQA